MRLRDKHNDENLQALISVIGNHIVQDSSPLNANFAGSGGLDNVESENSRRTVKCDSPHRL